MIDYFAWSQRQATCPSSELVHSHRQQAQPSCNKQPHPLAGKQRRVSSVLNTAHLEAPRRRGTAPAVHHQSNEAPSVLIENTEYYGEGNSLCRARRLAVGNALPTSALFSSPDPREPNTASLERDNRQGEAKSLFMSCCGDGAKCATLAHEAMASRTAQLLLAYLEPLLPSDDLHEAKALLLPWTEGSDDSRCGPPT